MSKDNSGDGDRLVVVAGSVQVATQVGAGRAYVDVPRGQDLPADVSTAEREQLLARNAVAYVDADGRSTLDDDEWRARYGDQPRPETFAARPVPGIVEPDEINPDVVPAGTVEDILAWVGDDLARARVARHEEEAKGNDARAALLTALDEVMTAVETEPPAVPEHLVEDGKAGGIADPDTVTPAQVDAPTPVKATPAKATKAVPKK